MRGPIRNLRTYTSKDTAWMSAGFYLWAEFYAVIQFLTYRPQQAQLCQQLAVAAAHQLCVLSKYRIWFDNTEICLDDRVFNNHDALPFIRCCVCGPHVWLWHICGGGLNDGQVCATWEHTGILDLSKLA